MILLILLLIANGAFWAWYSYTFTALERRADAVRAQYEAEMVRLNRYYQK